MRHIKRFLASRSRGGHWGSRLVALMAIPGARKLRTAASLFAIGVVSVGTLTLPAAAAPPTPGPVIDDVYPAGIACSDFDLRVTGDGGKRQQHTFLDENGDLVQFLETGTGSALTFTNETTGESVSFESKGSVARITFNPDDTFTFEVTGLSVTILFPTDVPAGPSTTLVAGRVVFTVDQDGVFTVLQMSGEQTDICALLS